MERRTKDRHNLQLICRVGSAKVLSAPMPEAGASLEAAFREATVREATVLEATVLEATTENMSRDGILMRWLKEVPLPERGAALTVEVDLPENAGFGRRVMRCATTVVRILQQGDGHSVGLHIDNVRFTAARKGRTVKSANTGNYKTGNYNLESMRPATDKVV